ncbi:hypothetical protein AB4K20DRAFT_1870500 [Rhizopus microsporus]
MKLIEDRKGVKLNFIFANTGKPNGKVLAKDEAKNLYLRKVHIPASEESTSLLAEYLAAILSLKRAVVKNFKTIECIMKVVQDEDLKLLFNRFDVSCFRDDSSCSSDLLGQKLCNGTRRNKGKDSAENQYRGLSISVNGFMIVSMLNFDDIISLLFN